MFGSRYFSWNAGLVHFVAISTEIYFTQSPEVVKAQYDFIDSDLRAANRNRSSAPWIVVYGHRPLYCSCDGDCDGDATRVRNGILFGSESANSSVLKYGMEELFYR